MMRIRVGAVSYLNARPCVAGLDRHPRFDLRFDLPARCAALLHEGAIDLGLVPSIEYLRAPEGAGAYRIVPDVAIASDGPVASVAVYTTKPMADVRSIALDTSSRTSVALTRVLCARAWGIDPRLEPIGPDLGAMLERCDAALIIGDAALFLDHPAIEIGGPDKVRPTSDPYAGRILLGPAIEKIDLGETWTATTGLPFVYAFWAGRPEILTTDDVRTVQEARDAGVADPEGVARAYLGDGPRQAIGAKYLRDNIKYSLGEPERAGLETFYLYAAELGLVPQPDGLRFY
jgi:chorismate dehydratase